MAHQSNGHLDSWTLQLNSTFLKFVLGKQTKYPNNIIIKHKYSTLDFSSDYMTKLAKKKYLRKDFVHKFQDVMAINCFPWHFEMSMKNIFLKFHFRLPSHKNTTINVFDTCPIRLLFGLPKNYNFRKVEFSCKFQLPRSKNHHPIITQGGSYMYVKVVHSWTTLLCRCDLSKIQELSIITFGLVIGHKKALINITLMLSYKL